MANEIKPIDLSVLSKSIMLKHKKKYDEKTEKEKGINILLHLIPLNSGCIQHREHKY